MSEYLSPFSLKEGFTDSSTPEAIQVDTPSPVLKDLIVREKANLDDLIRTAKQLNPVVQKIAPLDTAYDAAFESASERPIPAAGATLQGFALLLLVISYVCLVLVSVITVNMLTGNVMTAGKVFAGFLAVGLIGYAILTRYG